MVYVQDINGKPMMPTTRYGKVRRLLKDKKAVVVNLCPFTIKLTYVTSDYKQEIVLGVDAGTRHVGLSATTKSKELYKGNELINLNENKKMAEVGYNSKFEGQEVDSRLENVVQAAPGTGSESGKGGLIPAPPAGSQDGSKTLLSNMTWGDHVTKQYIDDAVSAAGWKKQIVSKLPTVEEAKDNVMYLVKDDVASTETKNVYNEYILVTEEGGGKVLESLGMVSTGVEMTFLDIDKITESQGTVSDDIHNSVVSAYENKIIVGMINGRIVPIVISKEQDTYSISLAYCFNDESVLSFVNAIIVLNKDKSFTYSAIDGIVSKASISFLNFMTGTPSVVTTLANLPKKAHNIIANVASATNLSMAVSAEDVGREWQVRVNNTTGTDITQPLPTSGLFQSMSGDSVVVPKNSFIELSIWYINDKLVIRVGEQA